MAAAAVAAEPPKLKVLDGALELAFPTAAPNVKLGGPLDVP